MTQVTKKEHFLPEMYLKNFIDGSGKLWQKNLRYGTYKHITPAQTGYRKSLYETRWKNPPCAEKEFVLPNYLENHFSSREKAFSECITTICQKIRLGHSDISSITPDERKTLAEFTTNLFLRHPQMMQSLKVDVISQEDIDNQQAKELYTRFGVETETVLLFEKKLEWLDSRFPGGYHQDVQGIFENMNLSFLISGGVEFVTCDWSVLFASNEGEISCFLLPLTPECCVCYNASVIKEGICHMPDNMVRLYNKLHLEKKSSRMKYLYARRKEDIEMMFS